MSRKKKSGSQAKARGKITGEKIVSHLVADEEISRHTGWIVSSVFLLLLAILALTSSLQKSPTVDEPLHLFAGYSYLKWGDFRINPEHPPLAKIVAALPLLAIDIRDPRPSSLNWNMLSETELRDRAVDVAQEMLFRQNDANTLFFYAKAAMILVGIVLGIFVFLWSRSLAGTSAALASLFFYCLDPNILAHLPVIQTDILFTATFFIATYFFWLTLKKMAWSNLSLTAVFFGLAAITKHSFPVILIIWGSLGLVWIFVSTPSQTDLGVTEPISGRRQKAWILTRVLLVSLAAAYLFVWATYGFRFAAIPGGHHASEMAQVMPDGAFVRAWARLMDKYRIFPEAWINGQLFVLKNLKRPAYLLGETSPDGFRLYFPVTFIVKTPLPTLLLLLGFAGLWLRRRERIGTFFLLIPVVAYFLLAIFSRLNIGVRHLLPIYPFLFVIIGVSAASYWKGWTWPKRAGLIFLALWYLWSAVSSYPHYLAYFSELAGGPANGHKILVDSNLDWGQDLKGLKRWMDENRVEKIGFLYFGKAEPQYYGIDAFYLPGSWVVQDSSNNKIPNYLAVSATFNYAPAMYLTQPEEAIVKTFKSGDPVATIGYSILLYKVDVNDAKISFVMGHILGHRGQVSQAIELFNHSLRTDPEFTEAHVSLAQLLAAQGRRDEAAKHYNDALRILKSRPASKMVR